MSDPIQKPKKDLDQQKDQKNEINAQQERKNQEKTEQQTISDKNTQNLEDESIVTEAQAREMEKLVNRRRRTFEQQRKYLQKQYSVKTSDFKSKEEILQKIWERLLSYFQNEPLLHNQLKKRKKIFFKNYDKRIDLNKPKNGLPVRQIEDIRRTLQRKFTYTPGQVENNEIYREMYHHMVYLEEQHKKQKWGGSYLKLLKKDFERIIPYSIFHIGRIYVYRDNKVVKIPNILERDESYQPCHQLLAKSYQENLVIPNNHRMQPSIKILYLVMEQNYQEAYDFLTNTYRNEKHEDFQTAKVLELLLASFKDLKRLISEMPQQARQHFKKTRTFCYQEGNQELEKKSKLAEIYLKRIASASYGRYPTNEEFRVILSLLQIMGSEKSQDKIELICADAKIEIFARFLMARKYLEKERYDNFVKNIKKKMQQKMRMEYLIFINHETDNFCTFKKLIAQMIKENKEQFQKICLTCLVILENYIQFNDKEQIEDKYKQITDYLIEKVLLFKDYVDQIKQPGYNYELKIKIKEMIRDAKNMTEKFQNNITDKQSFYDYGDVIIKGYRPDEMREQQRICDYCQKPYSQYQPVEENFKGRQFKIFTKCHKCSHGGHSGHFIPWFKTNTSCKVKGCQCKCSQLHPPSRVRI